MNEVLLKTCNITKRYKKQVILKNINMTVRKGDIYGFIGANGAGKTTLMRIITGLSHEDGGDIEILGEKENIDNSRMMLGSLIESPAFYNDMTAAENLEVSRRVRNIPGENCIKEALDLVGLGETGKKKFKDFSLGMKQRLGIANALLGSPRVLILDEPINGLDPIGIIEIRDMLKRINKENEVTILISSHILSELSELATCYGIIEKGILIEEISSKDLEEKCKQYIEVSIDNTSKAATLLENKLGISSYEVLENGEIRIYECLDKIGIINSELVMEGIIIKKLNLKSEKLEDYFRKALKGDYNV